jgi:argininosuccinate synthase
LTRIVLADSGGFDTAAAIPWLSEQHQAEVVTLTLDLGQGGELTDVRERALAAGAVRAHVIDAREELVRDYITPSLHAGALHQGQRPLAAALGRALIARRLADVARMESTNLVAHGAGLEVALGALDPSLASVPLMPRPLNGARPGDVNLWGRSLPEGGSFTLTRAANDCPDEPAYLEIEFGNGIPVRANGIEMPMIELIESLEIIAGAHGVGRLEEGGRAHEAPAAVLLHEAHDDLEASVIPPDLHRLKHDLARVYTQLVHDGRWFSPTREAIDAFARTSQPRVTGTVRLRLFKGTCSVVERSSPFIRQDRVVEAVAAQGLVS